MDNTLGLSCVAGNSIRAPDQETVLKAVQWALVHDLPVLPLGAGSNVILPPELGALALHLVDGSVRELQRDAQSVTLRVGAGKNWHELVEETLAAGFFGLENLALIPGLVGAAPVQNIGAYGVELSAFVKVVHGVDLAEPQIRSIGAAECAFAYRDSVFKQGLAGRFVITAVDFRLALVPQLKLSYPALKERLLVNADTADAAAVCARVMELRRERLPDPALQPNAGSFFKNPLVSPALAKRLGELYPSMPCFPAGERARKLSAAWLIERCGFKGERRGPV
ncbi:MAG: UDP-N-acetylmuramate dehydrogenase, partial [Halieaceae bacterium]